MSRPLRWLCKECCRSHICWCKSSSGRSPGSCSGLDSSLGEISGPSWRSFQKISLQKYRRNIYFCIDHIPCLQTYLDTLTLIWILRHWCRYEDEDTNVKRIKKILSIPDKGMSNVGKRYRLRCKTLHVQILIWRNFEKVRNKFVIGGSELFYDILFVIIW